VNLGGCGTPPFVPSCNNLLSMDRTGSEGIQTHNGLERTEKAMQSGCWMYSKGTGRFSTRAILEVQARQRT
jgi:hypothetical protein